jgi:hypothetical protein
MRRIALIVLLFASQTALARVLPDGGVTVQDVAASLRAKGYPTEITTDKDGDPLIRSVSDGIKFTVWFYECKGNPRCHSYQFATGFAQAGTSAQQVAEWNRTKRFGRAYLDRQYDPWVEVDMDVEHGATTEGLANNVDRWILVMSTFRKYIGR